MEGGGGLVFEFVAFGGPVSGEGGGDGEVVGLGEGAVGWGGVESGLVVVVAGDGDDGVAECEGFDGDVLSVPLGGGDGGLGGFDVDVFDGAFEAVREGGADFEGHGFGGWRWSGGGLSAGQRGECQREENRGKNFTEHGCLDLVLYFDQMERIFLRVMGFAGSPSVYQERCLTPAFLGSSSGLGCQSRKPSNHWPSS